MHIRFPRYTIIISPSTAKGLLGFPIVAVVTKVKTLKVFVQYYNGIVLITVTMKHWISVIKPTVYIHTYVRSNV